jgi:diphthamide synthase (EF-2-diphthine--ammonia ligase)
MVEMGIEIRIVTVHAWWEMDQNMQGRRVKCKNIRLFKIV